MLTNAYSRKLIAGILAKLRSGHPGSMRSALSRRKTPISFRPFLEALETRIVPSGSNFYIVTSTGDGAGSITGGAGSQGSPYQATTLRAAITAANNDGGVDTIEFAPSLTSSGSAIITLSTVGDSTAGPSDFGVTGNITIQGPTGSNGITLDNSGSQRLFYIAATGSLTVNNLTLEGGQAQGGAGGNSVAGGAGGGAAGLGGAVFDNGGSFTALGCTFTDNTATGGQGAVFSTMPGQGGGGGGGGLGFSGGNVAASGANGVSGGGPNGGGGGNVANPDGQGGAGGGFGGGGGGGGQGSQLPGAGGLGGFGGGGGGGGAGTNLGGAGGTGGFGGGGGGGGIGHPSGKGGPGGFGGGGGTLGGAGGGGAGLGGGIFSNGGTLTLTNDTFTANSAAGGSASFNASAGKGLGGAVFVRNGSLAATFVTFSSNTAAQGGTDLYVLSDGSDGGNNTSPGSGTATAKLVNDILGQTSNAVTDFASATNGGGSAPTFTGSSNDLVRSGGAALGAAVVSTADPMLSALASNGGPTQTMAPMAGSPVIEAGTPVNGITTDQRGVTRGNPPFLGAFEQPAVVLNTSTLTFTATEGMASGTQPLATFTDPAGAEPAGNYSVSINWGDNTPPSTGTVAFTPTTSTFITSGLSDPAGLAFDKAGNLYVANNGNNTVSEYSSTGTLINANYITGLSDPYGPAFDSAGNLYVANYFNGTVSEYSSTGSLITAAFASGLGQPDGLAFDKAGNLYVASFDGNTVSEYSSTGSLINASFASGLSGPQGLAFDSAGNLYVANSNGSTVSEFSPTGSLITAAFASGLINPAALAFDSVGNLYVANFTGGTVSEYSSTGSLITASFASGLNSPQGLAFDAAGNLYAANSTTVSKTSPTFTVTAGHVYAEEGSYTVQTTISHGMAPNTVATSTATVSDPAVIGAGVGVSAVEGQPFSGATVATFTDPGGAEPPADYSASINWGDNTTSPGTVVASTPTTSTFISGLNGPEGLAFDAAGNLYVANFDSSTVSEYSSTGSLINASFASGLSNPFALAFDAAGNLYVANGGSGTVSEYSSTGSLINASFASGLNEPQGLAFDKTGNLFVANDGSGTVSEYSSTGSLINASFASGLNAPDDVTFDAAGNLYVSNGGGTVSEYSSTGSLINASFISGLSNPAALAFDTAGNVYVANQGSGTVSEHSNTGSLINASFASGLSNPQALAFDAAGNLYAPNLNSNTVSKTSPTFAVTAGHVYAQEGSYTVQTTISHGTAANTVVTSTATVSDPAVIGAGVAVSAVEGQPFSGATVATFTDPGTAEPPADYSVSINWGDNTPASTGTVVASTPTTSTFTSSGLNGPTYLAFDTAGNLYVANFTSGTVSEYSSTGSMINANFISGLSDPTGLAFDKAGNLYVANYDNGMVSEYSSTGTLINASFASGLNGPEGLAFDKAGNLYVANQNGGTVSEYSSSGSLITASFASGLLAPEGLAFDKASNLYVANYSSGTVSEYSISGGLLNSSFASGLSNPTGLAFDSAGNLYVANQTGGTVSEYSSRGSLINASFASGLNRPQGLAFDKAGNLYAANNNTVSKTSPTFTVTAGHVYAQEGSYTVTTTISHGSALNTVVSSTATVSDPAVIGAGVAVSAVEGQPFSGVTVATFTDPGTAEPPADYTASIDWGDNTPASTGTVVASTPTTSTFTSSGLDGPTYLAFDTAGNLYVANFTSGTVSEYSSSGSLINPSFASGLSNPLGLAFDAAGNLYVANDGNNTVSEYSSTGSLITASYITGLNGPEDLAFDAAGNLYVSNYNSGTVSEYSSTGSLITASFASGLNEPEALAFDKAGNLYVGNFGSGTVSEYGSTGSLITASFISGLSIPSGLAFDAAGNLYVSNGSGPVREYSSTGSLINASFISGLNGPYALAFDAAGNLYAANFSNDTVSKTSPTFAVTGGHVYAQEGSYTVTTTISHGTAPNTVVSSSATVSDPSVIGTGGFTLDATTGTIPVGMTVATFTDPGGPEALSHYSADINWGTGYITGAGTISYNSTSQQFTVTNNVAAIFPGGGTFPLQVEIHHDVSTPTVVTDMVTAPALALDTLNVVHTADPTDAVVISNSSLLGSPSYSATSQSDTVQTEQLLDLIVPSINYDADYDINAHWLRSDNGSNPNPASNPGWYFLLPDGTLHQWDGVQNSATATSSPIVATLSQAVYNNPQELATATTLGTMATPGTAAFEESTLDLMFTGSYLNGDYGINADWFKSGNGNNSTNGGWYFLTPTGQLYLWTGITTSTGPNTTLTQALADDGTLVATLNETYWQDPNQLLGAALAATAASEQPLDLLFTGSYLNSDYGINADWLMSGNNSNPSHGNWYFLTPTGQLYQWTGGTSATASTDGTPVATLSPAFWQDPSLLFNPTAPQTPPAGYSAAFLANPSNVLKLSGFKNTGQDFSVQVSISNGGSTTTQEVLIHVTDQAPTLSSVAAPTVKSSSTLPVTLTGYDPDPNETLTYAGQVFTDSVSAQAVASGDFATVQSLGLSSFQTFTNFSGEWMRSTNDSNSANGGWYFLLSDGTLHEWDGGQTSATATTSPVVATFDPTFYTNIAKLLNPAVAMGVTATPSGNVVRFGGFNAFATQTLYAVASVSDDVLKGYTTFTITVSPSLISPAFNLTADTDTGILGDDATADSVVSLTGATNAGVALTLLSGPLEGSQTVLATGTSDSNGNFTFSNVHLSPGENFFAVQATGASGATATAANAILLTTSPSLTTDIGDVTTDTSQSPTTVDLLDPSNPNAIFSDSDGSNFPVVQYNTSFGSYNVQLFGATGEAPQTVANFLQYVNSGEYNNTVIDSSVPGFVVQGGGFTSPSLTPVTNLTTTLPNEPGISNTLGTIAMAKQLNEPNSATSAFFFNMADNSGSPNNLDTQNGGFTVFGEVTTGTTTSNQPTAGINILNQINAVQPTDLSSTFPTIPLQNFTAGSTPTASNFVLVNSVSVVNPVTYTVNVQPGSTFNSASFNAGVRISGNTLTIDPTQTGTGTATITITATNSTGQQVTSNPFTVTVNSPPLI